MRNLRFIGVVAMCVAGLCSVSLGRQEAEEGRTKQKESTPSIVGTWVIDAEGMKSDERFKQFAGSERGQFAIAYLAGVSWEFTRSGEMKMNPMGTTATYRAIPDAPGKFEIKALGGTDCEVQWLSESRIVFTSPEPPTAMLLSRVFDPAWRIVGEWNVDEAALRARSKDLGGPELAAVLEEARAMTVLVERNGSVSVSGGGAKLVGKAREVMQDGGGARFDVTADDGETARLDVGTDGGATLMRGAKTWPLARSQSAVSALQGRWIPDAASLREMEWFKKLPEADQQKRLDEIAPANEPPMVTEITAEQWGDMGPYEAKVTRPGVFGIYIGGELRFHAELVGPNRLLVHAGYGRVYPLKREGTK
ncbi:MAG TPA: hypothetical protein VG797_07940 [Phycisphaerales bacterium]|nr:hypothetical protein [Phycisphaerales bacterium]